MAPSYTRSALWRRPRSPGMRIALTCLSVALVIALAVYTIDLAELRRLLLAANPWWLLAALGLKLLTPLGTAALYARVLRLLGYTIRAAALWLTAQVAIFVTMAFPIGPLAMSAFLLRAFQQRRAPEGVITLAVAIDALTYLAAFLGLITVGRSYLLIHGALSVAQISAIGLIALAIVLGGMYRWGLQRDRSDLNRKAVRAQQWLARLLRRPWRSTSVEVFLADIYRGKVLAIGSIVRLCCGAANP